MIFSENYDMFRMAQTIYNSEVKKNPTLLRLDNITDFFGANFEGINSQFLSIYDFLTTENTKNMEVVDYSAISEQTEQGKYVLHNLRQNVSGSNNILSNLAKSNIQTTPHFLFTYIVGTDKYELKINNNVISFNHLGDFGQSEVVCFEEVLNNTPCVVIQKTEKVNDNQIEKLKTTTTVINAHTHAVVFAKQTIKTKNNQSNKSELKSTTVFKEKSAYILKQSDEKVNTIQKLNIASVIYSPEVNIFNIFKFESIKNNFSKFGARSKIQILLKIRKLQNLIANAQKNALSKFLSDSKQQV